MREESGLVWAQNLGLKKKGQWLLEPISFSFGQGLHLIEGESGCGKSTLLKILFHAEKPSCGRLFIPRGAATCFLSQKDVLPPEWSVEETLGFYLSLPLKCSFSRSRFLDLLALFSLNSVLTLPAQSLGDGERHALALLFALATSADVYLLDEPFALLDDQRKKIALAQIEELSIHRVVVVVNHESDIHFAHSLASRIVFQGKRAQVSALSLLPLSPAAASRKKRISEPFALALKHHFHWSVSSLLRLLLLGCFLLSSGLAFASSVPSDEALDAFMEEKDPYSVLQVKGGTSAPAFLSKGQGTLNVIAPMLFYRNGYALYGAQSFVLTIDPSLADDSFLYYYPSADGPVLSSSLSEAKSGLSFQADDESYRAAWDSAHDVTPFSLTHADLGFVNLAAFQRLFLTGFYSSFITASGLPLGKDPMIDSFQIRLEKNASFTALVDASSLDFVAGENIVGLDGFPAGAEIRYGENAPLALTRSYPISAQERKLHLSWDAFLSFGEEMSAFSLQVERASYASAYALGYRYDGPLRSLQEGNASVKPLHLAFSILASLFGLFSFAVLSLKLFLHHDSTDLFLAEKPLRFFGSESYRWSLYLLFGGFSLALGLLLYAPFSFFLCGFANRNSSFIFASGSRFAALSFPLPLYVPSLWGYLGYSLVNLLLIALLFLLDAWERKRIRARL